MKSFKELRDKVQEAHQVVAKTKEGETFKSAVYTTKKQAMDMHYKMAKGNKYAKVDTVKVQEETQTQGEAMSSMDKYLAAINGNADFNTSLEEKTLTAAELKKREEVAQAMERENPDMPMDKKMAIATAQAKKVAEETYNSDVKRAFPASGVKTGAAAPKGTSYMPKDKKKAMGTPAAGMKEEAEELDEVSYSTLQSYKQKALAQKASAYGSSQIGSGILKKRADDIMDKRSKGIAAATKKMDESEELDEKAHTVPKSEKEKDLAKIAPPHDKITHADVMVGRGVKKEEVELDEAKDMMKVAGDIEAYAKKHGGIDKADMLKVAGMIKRGDMKGAGKYTMTLDSDPRDFLLSKMGVNEEKDVPFEGPYTKAKDVVTDKSGAKHTAMSRVRDIARKAMQKQKPAPVKEEADLDEEQLDELSVNKMLNYRAAATKQLVTGPADKEEKRKAGLAVSGEKIKAALKKEEAEDIEEASRMMKPTSQYTDKDGTVVNVYPENPKTVDIKPKPTGGRQFYKATLSKRFDKGNSMFAMKTSESVEVEEIEEELMPQEPRKATINGRKATVIGQVTGASQKHYAVQYHDAKYPKGTHDVVSHHKVSFEEETDLTEWKVKHDGVDQDHPDEDIRKLFAGKKDVTNHMTKYKSSAESRADQLKKKGFKNVRIEESVLEEEMISYTDFMDKIKAHRKAGNKVIDDKYTSGKASYTTVSPEGHGRKVIHTPTGQKVETLGKMKGDDDEASEVKPAEKRGRGRPAGSKSGVSKYNK